jgi:hypothetical protein
LKVSEICPGTMTFAVQSDEATAIAILGTADAYPIPPRRVRYADQTPRP